MTEQDRQLLLKDLCARLLYGVMVNRIGTARKLISVNIKDESVSVDYGQYVPKTFFIDEGEPAVKPYLRPMSSMTEEELEQYHKLQSDIWKPCGTMYYDNYRSIDWLNKNMFDYRDLIEKDLAISTEVYNPYYIILNKNIIY